MKRRALTATVAAVACMLGLGLAAAPQASANDGCYRVAKGKICMNGFDAGDWSGHDSFMGVQNTWPWTLRFRITFHSPTSGNKWRYQCIGAGKVQWYDRDTVSVNPVIYSPAGGC